MPANIGTAERQFFREWAHTTRIVTIGAPDDKHPYEQRVYAWTIDALINHDNALPRTLYVLLQEAKGIFEDREAKRARAKAANRRGGGPGIENTHKQCWRKILVKLKDFYSMDASAEPTIPPHESPPHEIEIKSGNKEEVPSLKLTDEEIQKLVAERDKLAKKVEILEATLAFERKESESQRSDANAKTAKAEGNLEYWKDQCAYKEELLIKKDEELQDTIRFKDKMLQGVERELQQALESAVKSDKQQPREEKRKTPRCAKEEVPSPSTQPDPRHGRGFLLEPELPLKSEDQVLETCSDRACAEVESMLSRMFNEEELEKLS